MTRHRATGQALLVNEFNFPRTAEEMIRFVHHVYQAKLKGQYHAFTRWSAFVSGPTPR